MGDLTARDLASTAWAFAKMDLSDKQLFSALERMAEQCIGCFNQQDIQMALWALSRHCCLEDAWNLFAHAEHVGISFRLPCASLTCLFAISSFSWEA